MGNQNHWNPMGFEQEIEEVGRWWSEGRGSVPLRCSRCA